MLAILEQVYAGASSALHFDSVWQLAVAVILSAQTNDNQVNKITGPLFAQYPDAAAFARLSPKQLEPLIATCGLYRSKAKNIIATAQVVVEKYGGNLPAERELLLELPGIGRKSANVILSVGFGIPALAVDTHVQRVANRTGMAKGKTPAQTEAALCAWIPKEQWSAAHHWLIWHGRQVCTARKPHCAACPVADLCPACCLIGASTAR